MLKVILKRKMVEGKRYKINLDGYDFSQLRQNFL